ncbi:MAG: efflux RND transporter periplasmic adaptor subunit, partial [Campylobacterota bacterium]|nr:efflux RND transporter periplasmic adaptor subunit [Campylobacterota bacterium]
MSIQRTILSSLFISSLLLFSACSEEKKIQVKKEIPPLKVNTITVKKEPVPIWKQYTGMTKASSDQDVQARVSGVLEEIYFKDGQAV